MKYESQFSNDNLGSLEFLLTYYFTFDLVIIFYKQLCCIPALRKKIKIITLASGSSFDCDLIMCCIWSTVTLMKMSIAEYLAIENLNNVMFESRFFFSNSFQIGKHMLWLWKLRVLTKLSWLWTQDFFFVLHSFTSLFVLLQISISIQLPRERNGSLSSGVLSSSYNSQVRSTSHNWILNNIYHEFSKFYKQASENCFSSFLDYLSWLIPSQIVACLELF